MDPVPSSSNSVPSSSNSLQESQPCRRFEFPEIQLATNDFDESFIIGHGGFGNVYKGNIINGSSLVVAAIKRLDFLSNQGATEFWAEVEMLSKFRHCNIVSLIGYCNYGKEMILVYEYMPNGTLGDHLHKLGTQLSWLQRLNICIGAARGLHYLHTGTGNEVGVIHRDVKSSNILLNENWAAKISDFGLSKIGPTNQPSTYVNTLVKGTFGYLDPDYYATGKLTRKSDVYAFGVILLEVLCRKLAVDSTLHEEQWNLARWVQESIEKGNLKHIIDTDIRSQISPKCLKEFVRIAKRCLYNDPKQRLTMAEVVVSLESVLISQEKFNASLQQRAGNKTIFGRMVDMLPFPSNGENSAQGDSKLSSNTKNNSTGPVGNTVGADQNMLTRAGNTVGADQDMFVDTREVPADNKIQSLKEFKFDDLQRATRNFSRNLLLSERGYGRVFLGWVHKDTFAPSTRRVGIAVAVKRLENGIEGHEALQREVSLLGQLAHPNIIRLLGYCNDKEDKYLLVYEYMQNQSLEQVLFAGGSSVAPLSWETRIMIMIGVARGLTYLHSIHSLEAEIVFHGFTSSNVLLDQDFNAKLRNFWIDTYDHDIMETLIATTNVIGNYGYMAPEFKQTGDSTAKNDVYSFGMVLLEILTGQREYDTRRPKKKLYLLVESIRPMLASRTKLKQIMDPRLKHNYPLEAAFKYVELALRCLERETTHRPSSEEVLQSLEQIYAVNY